MTVLITLTIAGTDTGPFDLYSNLDFFAVPFETNVSKVALQGGYSSSLVPDYTTVLRVKSQGECINYVDINLITPTTSTTTSTTTLAPDVPCNSNITAGGTGISNFNINLSPSGGLVTLAFNAQSVPDKMEIIHNGVKKATSGMTAANGGPFDNLYGDPVVPTAAQASVVDQFIGTSKGSIPTRQATFASDTGSGLLIPGGYQQIVWWQYTNIDYGINPVVVVRVTGPDGTSWDFQRMCETTTTTTTL